jgi:hypothetical protein
MKPIDMMPPSMRPQRSERRTTEGWEVRIKPPDFIGQREPVIVRLTEDQHTRMMKWLETGALIQDCLPDLSDSDREKLMTGLDDEQFAAASRSDDPD